ncbi:MAG: hypothetical protein LDL19_05370 [Thiobacillus sp.]|nr:hypothetical protein [Thiobacillus sp.]
MPQVLLGAGVAVMRTVQESFHAVQHYPETCAVMRFDPGAQMRQHGFHLAPVDVSAHRPVEYVSQQAFVLVTHGRSLR